MITYHGNRVVIMVNYHGKRAVIMVNYHGKRAKNGKVIMVRGLLSW